MLQTQPRSQGLSSSLPLERERFGLRLGSSLAPGVKMRDPGNDVAAD